MGILLGLVAALLYGGSDFAGGLASRRFGSVRITIAGSPSPPRRPGRCSSWPAAPGRACGPSPGGWPAAWQAGPATSMLYRGLARGQMSVVGPVSAVGAAVFRVIAGVALGKVLGVAGVLAALPAIVLVAGLRLGVRPARRRTPRRRSPRGPRRGLAFGILFIGLAQAGRMPAYGR